MRTQVLLLAVILAVDVTTSEAKVPILPAQADGDRMDALENQLKEARSLAEDADRKYDEVTRKLALLEADLERSEDRLENSESKIVEKELIFVGNNLKSLQVSQGKLLQREEEFKEQIKTTTSRLNQAEARAEFAERSVQKLQKEVDRLEGELVQEKVVR